jgi:23S rRNA (cytosine1962-C5)-methyltransferase
MSDPKITMFRNRLHKVAKHLSKHARREGLTCYRVYDHDLPEFPLCIEFYDDKLYVAEYRRRHGMTDEEHDDWMEKTLEVIMEVLHVKRENIFLKLRQRKPGRLGQYQKTGASLHEFVVTENGLKFLVNLSDYLDTGLFLDHRITRQLVREQSAGKKVLNLFAYTGSFSVYAAAGKAKEVVTVDLSKTYLDWAQRNFDLNNPLFDTGQNFRFVHADVKKWLALSEGKDFDIIIMDPPTFSNSKRMDGMLDIQRDHVALINHCMEALVPGGQLYFSTNFRKFILEKEQLNAATIKDITRQTTPFDFEGRLFRFCYLLIK